MEIVQYNLYKNYNLFISLIHKSGFPVLYAMYRTGIFYICGMPISIKTRMHASCNIRQTYIF